MATYTFFTHFVKTLYPAVSSESLRLAEKSASQSNRFSKYLRNGVISS